MSDRPPSGREFKGVYHGLARRASLRPWQGACALRAKSLGQECRLERGHE